VKSNSYLRPRITKRAAGVYRAELIDVAKPEEASSAIL